MGPAAVQLASARFSAAPPSMARACLTSLHQFFRPAAVHDARSAGEDVPKLFGKAVKEYYREKVTTWDTDEDCFTVEDVVSAKAESRSAGPTLSTEVDRTMTWIETNEQDPEFARDTPRGVVLFIGFYTDGLMVATKRLGAGKKAESASCVKLFRLDKHWYNKAKVGKPRKRSALARRVLRSPIRFQRTHKRSESKT